MTDVTVHQNKPPIVVLKERLEAREGELRNALTDIDPKHFIRAIITAAQIDPNLQACSFQSLWLAAMRACRDNLLPDGREGAIIAFKDKAQWIPMYAGLLKRFRQSGECKWIGADVVREGEVFEHWVDQTGEHFKHVPEGDESKPIIKVYAAALTKDDAFYVAVLSMTEINKIRNVSRTTRDDSPWKMWPAEMQKKTALRRLSKLLPAGRDIFQEEEEERMPPPSLAVDNEAPRQPGAAAALDSFAGTHHTPLPEPEGLFTDVPEDPAAVQDALSIAYERGRIAAQTGAQRRAIPGEYRDEKNRREAAAWHAGYDGKEDPTSGEIPS